MRAKRFLYYLALVIITGASGCDNVSFEGVRVEIRPPVPPPGMPTSEADTVTVVEEPLTPIDIGPLLYLVERTGETEAVIAPIALISQDGYSALPESEEIPDYLERFALERWEPGAEFTLLGNGGRVGTFVSLGETGAWNGTCEARPRASGRLEVSPQASTRDWFLALPQTVGPEALAPALSPGESDADVRAAALNLAQRLIPALSVPWPTSIPDIRRDLQSFSLVPDGPAALATSHVFADQIRVGSPTPNSYSLFFIGVADSTRYQPVVSWYQRGEWGKAVPRFVGAHDVRDTGMADIVLEVFGQSSRWLTILGANDGDWTAIYRDSCGEDAARGAIQSYP